MATEQLEKLKNSIKPDLLEKFDKNLMVSSGFIPVDIRNNDVFIIIKKSVSSNKPSIESTVKTTCSASECGAKFISLSDEEFGELCNKLTLATVPTEEKTVTAPVQKPNDTNLISDEAYFVSKGLVRSSDVAPAKELAQTKKMPLF